MLLRGRYRHTQSSISAIQLYTRVYIHEYVYFLAGHTAHISFARPAYTAALQYRRARNQVNGRRVFFRSAKTSFPRRRERHCCIRCSLLSFSLPPSLERQERSHFARVIASSHGSFRVCALALLSPPIATSLRRAKSIGGSSVSPQRGKFPFISLPRNLPKTCIISNKKKILSRHTDSATSRVCIRNPVAFFFFTVPHCAPPCPALIYN